MNYYFYIDCVFPCRPTVNQTLEKENLEKSWPLTLLRCQLYLYIFPRIFFYWKYIIGIYWYLLEKIISIFTVQYSSLFAVWVVETRVLSTDCHNPACLPANFKQMMVLVSDPTPPPQSQDHQFPSLGSY